MMQDTIYTDETIKLDCVVAFTYLKTTLEDTGKVTFEGTASLMGRDFASVKGCKTQDAAKKKLLKELKSFPVGY